MADLELKLGEEIKECVRADYWSKKLGMYSQNRGRIWITNQRIHVRAGWSYDFDIEMSQIASLKKSNISLILPIGIDVILKNGKKHRLAVMKRNQRMELIQSLMK